MNKSGDPLASSQTAALKLGDGRTLQLLFPPSPIMEEVIQKVFSGSEYPPIPFLDAAGSAVIDIGANIGCSTLIFGLQYPSATIYALEPSVETFSYLKHNAALLPGIRVFNVGAFDKDANAQFYPGRFASVSSSLVPGGETEKIPSETVQLRRISAFIREQGIQKIALLKIDTEGAEISILRDLQPWFERIDAMYLEYHSEADRREIDAMLAPFFTLNHSSATKPHRGICGYVSTRLLAAKTGCDAFAIAHPIIN